MPFNMENLNHTVKFAECRKIPQQNYLAKMDLDSSVFFCDNRVFLSNQVVMIPSRLGRDDTTWYQQNPVGHKDGIFMEKIWQVHFGKVVLLCPLSALT